MWIAGKKTPLNAELSAAIYIYATLDVEWGIRQEQRKARMVKITSAASHNSFVWLKINSF